MSMEIYKNENAIRKATNCNDIMVSYLLQTQPH